jgi:hypothetical protein
VVEVGMAEAVVEDRVDKELIVEIVVVDTAGYTEEVDLGKIHLVDKRHSQR